MTVASACIFRWDRNFEQGEHEARRESSRFEPDRVARADRCQRRVAARHLIRQPLALARVPGLQLENFQGRLGGQWRADRLLWQQGEDRVEVQSADFEWSPACLLKMTLCIDRLHAGHVLLHFPPNAEPATDSPVNLPTLNLPLSLQLGDVQLGSLQLDGVEQLRDLARR